MYPMHPDYALRLSGQDQDRRDRAASFRGHRPDKTGRRRGFWPWRVTWTTLSPGDLPAAGRQPRASVMIIISAGRPG